MKGFSFTQNEEEICEFLPLSSELIRKTSSDNIFTIGMAYSNMEMINISLIAAYDMGKDEEYTQLLKIYAPYVKEIAVSELEFMGVLPEQENKQNSSFSVSDYEELTNFLSNPNWSMISDSIKKSIKKISVMVSDDHPLKEGLMLRDLHKISYTLFIPGVAWYERPIATLPLAAKFLESEDFTERMSLQDFHSIVYDGIVQKIKEFSSIESQIPHFSDLAHDYLMTILRCARLAQDNLQSLYFSAIRYSLTSPLMHDISLTNQTLSCPFFLFCNDMVTRNQIKANTSESCIVRKTLADSLKIIERSIPEESCCSDDDFSNSEMILQYLPAHIENLLNCIIAVLSRKNECILCESLKNTLLEQNYDKKTISNISNKMKAYLQNNIKNVLFPK